MDPAKEWNRTETLYRPEATVHRLIREQAAAIPDRPALVWTGGQMTYRELDRRSDDLARRLVDEGVGPDIPVAVSIERSPEAVVAVLAILKAGGCYLPIDPQYPKERLTFIIGDANAPVLITRRSLASQLGALAPKTLFIEDPCAEGPALAERVGPTNLAYLMYTSGSTGNPKGVLIEHKSIVRLVGGSSFMRLSRDIVFLQAAPLGFDLSTLELWGALCHGGRVAIYLEAVPTGPGLARTIREHGITSAWLTSSLFNTVVDEDPKLLTGLCQLAIGGEALSPPHVLRALAALPDTEIINGYGPTEVTTFTTTHSIPRDTPKEAKSIPIGKPIADTQVYVLDPDRKEVPFGEVGELYAGGLGVARGYHNRPELDAERFIPDTFTGKGRLYKTGDLVRFLPDGTLDFIGRADSQVKIRGFRIELGEIEVALSHLPQVQAAAVIARDDGTGKRIVAYVVPSKDRFSPAELREALLERLPDFMIPTLFIRMPALPMNTNGKLDRKALPAPESTRPDLAQPYRAPSTEREKLVCQVFAELLSLDRVGVDARVHVG
ncbi:MAG: amino acid adenylation domain-containing protein, partial [Myxococcales bacterium]|nr:amino acid adenylation domain-containing protein [Myxococcales bacterium]